MLEIIRSIFKKENRIVLYFLFLLMILLSWTDYDNAPPQILRYGYFIALFIPLFFGYKNFAPSIIALFLTIGLCGYAFTYLPYQMSLYSSVLLILVFSKHADSSYPIGLSSVKLSYVLFFLMLLVDLIMTGSLEKVHWCMIIFIALFYCVSDNAYKDGEWLRLAFVLTSLILSYQFLKYGGTLATDYYLGGTAVTERMGWRIDPNYLGGIIGMGGIIAFINLLKRQDSSIYLKVFWGATIVLCLSALALNASRGAIVAFAGACAINIIVQKAKPWHKILFLAFIVGAVYYCYTNEMFTLLANRFEGDTTGSGRTVIWQTKLEDFFQQGNLLSFLFGFGRLGGLELGDRGIYGAHNEFVATLVEYGMIGLLVLILIFLSLLKEVPQKAFAEVFSLVLFLVIICFTLEPLTQGWVTYWVFLFYILMRVREEKYEEDQNFIHNT